MTTQADEKGWFNVLGVAPGRIVLAADAPGYAQTSCLVRFGPGLQNVRFTLDPDRAAPKTHRTRGCTVTPAMATQDVYLLFGD